VGHFEGIGGQIQVGCGENQKETKEVATAGANGAANAEMIVMLEEENLKALEDRYNKVVERSTNK
jgi:hypothetical protein